MSEQTDLAQIIMDRINEAATSAAQRMRVPKIAWVGADAYAALVVWAQSMCRLDMHEVCGDYDRPTSPWFGSRPMIRGLRLWTPGGEVVVSMRTSLDAAVIVEDTTGEPWIAT